MPRFTSSRFDAYQREQERRKRERADRDSRNVHLDFDSIGAKRRLAESLRGRKLAQYSQGEMARSAIDAYERRKEEDLLKQEARFRLGLPRHSYSSKYPQVSRLLQAGKDLGISNPFDSDNKRQRSRWRSTKPEMPSYEVLPDGNVGETPSPSPSPSPSNPGYYGPGEESPTQKYQRKHQEGLSQKQQDFLRLKEERRQKRQGETPRDFDLVWGGQGYRIEYRDKPVKPELNYYQPGELRAGGGMGEAPLSFDNIREDKGLNAPGFSRPLNLNDELLF